MRLRLTNAEVLFPNPGGSAPINIVDCAIKKAREVGGYDFIYCVFDRDPGAESFNRALDKLRANAKQHPLYPVISIPCFEYWVLLHFVNTDAPFDRCEKVIERLQQHLTDYIKGNREQIEDILNRLDDAVARANQLFPDQTATSDNPYTSAHRLVQHLRGIAAQEPKI